jgi:hypothetical protein
VLLNDGVFMAYKRFFLGMKHCDSSYDKSGEDRNGQMQKAKKEGLFANRNAFIGRRRLKDAK